ncbi:PEGA domain-containing protein [Myxococcota bacterium]|nr:PEGA domain-containing protein [Myxococcota bacterium]MBU1382797.1 PEGA domain-containing protein [Myxococcota bacterium]MBU1497380.1 PEGA domain-containing protein [Myxococcota bacterium]
MARLLLFISFLLVVPVSVSHAGSLKKAKENFEAGQALFGAGEFKKAAVRFLEAWKEKPMAAFLYNAAVCYEKIEDYELAKKYFIEYISAAPKARNVSSIQARIRLLDKLIKIKKESVGKKPDGKTPDVKKPDGKTPDVKKPDGKTPDVKKPDGKTPDVKKPDGKTPDVKKPDGKTPDVKKPDGKTPDVKKPDGKTPDVKKPVIILPPIETQSVVSVSCDPPGAELYLNDEKNMLGKTPWEGSIPKGKHIIIFKHKGFQTVKKEISVTSNRFMEIFVSLTKDTNLAWVQISTDVPDAFIYPGSKKTGPIGKTPWSGFLKPGAHKLLIYREGYDEIYKDIVVKVGESNQFNYNLKKTPISFISVFGKNVRNASVKIDGRTICVAPCLKIPVKSGKHRMRISKKGMKSVEKGIDLEPGDHKNYNVTLNSAPNRTGAITAYVIGLGSIGGAVWLGGLSKKMEDDYKKDIQNGVPVYSNDSRLQDGKIYSIAANALYGVSALAFVIAIYRTFADSGPDSTIDQTINIGTTSVGITPYFSGESSGVSLTVKF